MGRGIVVEESENQTWRHEEMAQRWIRRCDSGFPRGLREFDSRCSESKVKEVGLVEGESILAILIIVQGLFDGSVILMLLMLDKRMKILESPFWKEGRRIANQKTEDRN